MGVDTVWVPPGSGKSVYVRQVRVTLLATAEQTEGIFGLVAMDLAPGAGMETHLRRREEQAFYVLEGEVAFHLPTGVYQAPAGSFCRVARGLLHSFENTADLPARLLCMTTPGGSEGFYTEVGAAQPDEATNAANFTFAKDWNATAGAFGLEYPLSNPNAGAVVPFYKRHLQPASGETLRIFGDSVTLLASSAQTQGLYNLFLKESAPGARIPAHVHHRDAGAYYVLGGSGSWTLTDGREVPAETGSFFYCPPGAARAWHNAGADPLRLLILSLPGGLDVFYREIAGTATPTAAAGIAARYGVEFSGRLLG